MGAIMDASLSSTADTQLFSHASKSQGRRKEGARSDKIADTQFFNQ